MTKDKASLFYFLRPLVDNEEFMAGWKKERQLLLERAVVGSDVEATLNLVRALDTIEHLVRNGAAKINQPKD
jgi:hypothetical protein